MSISMMNVYMFMLLVHVRAHVYAASPCLPILHVRVHAAVYVCLCCVFMFMLLSISMLGVHAATLYEET
jgi:hypothetical protein